MVTDLPVLMTHEIFIIFSLPVLSKRGSDRAAWWLAKVSPPQSSKPLHCHLHIPHTSSQPWPLHVPWPRC